MDFEMIYLSFFVVQVEGSGEQAEKTYTHFQTLDVENYEEHELKTFLDGELMKISKRKVERHPKQDQVPTKIGRFIIEEGHDLTSNPNYNQFTRLRESKSAADFRQNAEQFVRLYIDTAAVRGGVFIVALAKLSRYFDEPFVFVMKCDYEKKVATITDERSLIRNIDRAITTKNMKSIQYPFMPEEGMLEDGEVKIHQASHARYFEDFLKYVEYEKSMPQLVKTQVQEMVQQHIQETYEENSPERADYEAMMETWADKEERELKETWTTEQVQEASSVFVERSEDLELKLNLDHIFVKALLSDFGDHIHFSKVNGRYILMIEGDAITFNKTGYSPVEFLKPDDFDTVVERLRKKLKS